ncbi:MAG: hypothetical protein ACRDNO_29250 [Trebonia sp.]
MESRRAYQDRIDKLSDAWDALARRVDTLADVITRAGGEIAGLELRAAEGITAEGVQGGDWNLAELNELRREIEELTPDIAAVRARFHRSTVNIGVVGQAAAGKSTLLRTITGLDEVVIPSGGLKPTTAARSRIQHSPGRAEAEVILRTWEEFRDGYLLPLHTDAGCRDPVPATADEFAKYPYQRLLESARSDAGRAPIDQQKFLRRMLVAQLSLRSYQSLLEQSRRELNIKSLPDLRPFVAYPADDSWERPYHAVHDVWIHCEFAVGDVENLVLVDLPGAGEAALNIEKQFLADLRNEVDVLLQVKRPVVTRSWIGADDWQVLKLADEARMGVQPADFISFVINTDPANVTPEQLSNAVAQARSEITTNPKGIRLLIGDVASESEVRQDILGPILERLAERLAIMDRTAAAAQVSRARAVAERVHVVVGRLAAEVHRRERRVPDDKRALDSAAKQLRNSVSKQLDGLIDEYDRQARDHEPVPELAEAIASARESLTRWAEAGFGIGSKEAWLVKVGADLSADLGETRDDQCTRVRRQLRQEFGRIDGSLTRAVDRLHTQVAGTLPQPLTAVGGAPPGEQPLRALSTAADGLRLESLRVALDTLLEVRASYGNIFLRVGGPVVDRVAQGAGPLPGEGTAPEPGDSPEREAGPRSRTFYRGARSVADVVSAVHPAAGPAAHAAAAAVPVVLGWIWESPISDKSPDGLHAALSRAFHQAVNEIEARMLGEAGLLSGVLAAALNQFKDDFIRDPDIEREWAEICFPARRDLWPRTFGGEAAALIAGYSRIAEATAASEIAAGDFLAVAMSTGSAEARR